MDERPISFNFIITLHKQECSIELISVNFNSLVGSLFIDQPDLSSRKCIGIACSFRISGSELIYDRGLNSKKENKNYTK